jgi:hypothetical protein
MKIRFTVKGDENAINFAKHLVWSSLSFKFDPLPDGFYSFDLKDEPGVKHQREFLRDWTGDQFSEERI